MYSILLDGEQGNIWKVTVRI